MQNATKTPFSNAQLELLKTFSHNLTEDEMQELRSVLVSFFANRLIKQADQTWSDKQWTDEKMDELLVSKLR